MRGILATAGAASAAALCFATPMSYTLTANVLTVTGYTAWGALDGNMDDLFQGEYCNDASGNSCTPVRYLSALPTAIAEPDGYRALRSAIGSITEPTTVVAYSQGATISTYWLRDNAGRPDAPAPENLSFVLAANPMRKYGGIRPASGLVRPTPETEYSVTDIAMEYDGVADFPDNPFNLLAVANAIAGFQYVHIFGYDQVDLDTADKLVWQDGNTTYVLVRSENIPLLQPLRILGLNDLADRLNAPLKAIIDSAYNRDYPGMVDADSLPGTTGRQLPAATAGEEGEDDADVTVTVSTASSSTQDSTGARTAKRVGSASEQSEDLETDSSTTDVETVVDDADIDDHVTDTGQDGFTGDDSDTDELGEDDSVETDATETDATDTDEAEDDSAETDAAEDTSESDDDETSKGAEQSAPQKDSGADSDSGSESSPDA